jgi:hypothetical protein
MSPQCPLNRGTFQTVEMSLPESSHWSGHLELPVFGDSADEQTLDSQLSASVREHFVAGITHQTDAIARMTSAVAYIITMTACMDRLTRNIPLLNAFICAHITNRVV